MTPADMDRARMRPRHKARDFATQMRDAGLKLCDGCGDWCSDTSPVCDMELCGWCNPFPINIPNPDTFPVGSLEHEMAQNLAKETT